METLTTGCPVPLVLGFTLLLVAYAVAALCAYVELWGPSDHAQRRSRGLLRLAFLGHAALTVALLARGHLQPGASSALTLVLSSLLLSLGYVMLSWVRDLPQLGTFVAPAALVALTMAALRLSAPPTAGLSGALIAAHVVLVSAAYAFFGCGAAGSLMYLFQDWALRRRRFQGASARLPSLERLDRVLSISLLAGLPLFTLALALGTTLQLRGAAGPQSEPLADARVLAASGIWLGYALLLPLQLRHALPGRRIAALSLVAFALIVASHLFAQHGFL